MVKEATLELSHAHVTRMRPMDGTCNPEDSFGRGVVFGANPLFEIDGQRGSIGHGTVTHVAVDKYIQSGITVVSPAGGPPSIATISHNIVIGGTQIPVEGQAGIEIIRGAVAQVTENIVRGNVCTAPSCGSDPINEPQSAGIFAFFARSGSHIAENRVDDNDIGIYQLASPNCCTISKNHITNNRFFGIIIQDGDGTTSGNRIRGGQTGIGVVADAVDTVGVLRGDKITRTSRRPLGRSTVVGFRQRPSWRTTDEGLMAAPIAGDLPVEYPMLTRRFFMAALAALVGPVVAAAQPPAKIARIGILRSGSPPEPWSKRSGRAFTSSDTSKGRNLSLEYRWAEGNNGRLAGLAGELVRLKVDVIVRGASTPLAAKRATSAIPIVMPARSDP